MICEKETDTELSWYHDDDELLVQFERDNGKVVLDGTLKDFLEYLTYERLSAYSVKNRTGKLWPIAVRV